jgi:hypothetical protein
MSTLPELLEDPIWQMSRGERAAVEGLLSQLKPELAIEIGSMEGACLRRIAAHAKEVHSFDLAPPTLAQAANVRLHTGDSHELLPAFLAELAEQRRNVDFVIVDGDHTPDGVRSDIEDLLDSRAVARTVILIHDMANEGVRRGAEAVRFAAWPKVAHVELDWIPGQLFAEAALRNELWYGLGLVLVDSSRVACLDGPVHEQRYYPAGHLLQEIRELVVARERVPPPARTSPAETEALRRRVAQLQRELAGTRTRESALSFEVAELREVLKDITESVSWRMTEPLRTAKRTVHGARRSKHAAR